MRRKYFRITPAFGAEDGKYLECELLGQLNNLGAAITALERVASSEGYCHMIATEI